jgi:hypothetical protein
VDSKVIAAGGNWKVYLEGDSVATISISPFLNKGEDGDVTSFGFSDLTVADSLGSCQNRD